MHKKKPADADLRKLSTKELMDLGHKEIAELTKAIAKLEKQVAELVQLVHGRAKN